MTTVYLVRHGTTDGNREGRFQGKRLNIPLNERGRKQGEYLAQRFADVHLDAVYTSPLIRARETAEFICRGKNLTPILRDDIMEIDGGVMDGRLMEENMRDYPVFLDAMMHKPAAFNAPGGEETRQVYDRMRKAIAEMVAAHPGGTIAIVSHGYALMTYNNYMKGVPFENLFRFMMGNMAVSTVTYDDPEKPVLHCLGDESHIPKELRFLHGSQRDDVADDD